MQFGSNLLKSVPSTQFPSDAAMLDTILEEAGESRVRRNAWSGHQIDADIGELEDISDEEVSVEHQDLIAYKWPASGGYASERHDDYSATRYEYQPFVSTSTNSQLRPVKDWRRRHVCPLVYLAVQGTQEPYPDTYRQIALGSKE